MCPRGFFSAGVITFVSVLSTGSFNISLFEGQSKLTIYKLVIGLPCRLEGR